MTTGETWGLIGGIVGGLIGVAGGIVGTYLSIKNTTAPRARAFTVRAAAVCWVAVTIHLVLLFVLPDPYKEPARIAGLVLMVVGIAYGNKRLRKIAGEESQNQASQAIGGHRAASA